MNDKTLLTMFLVYIGFNAIGTFYNVINDDRENSNWWGPFFSGGLSSTILMGISTLIVRVYFS
jgi:hypothetical protein